MGINEAYNAAGNNTAVRTKPASPPPAKIPVTDRPFDIIDENNFVSYINSSIGLNFIKHLDGRVRTEKDTNIKNEIKYILDSLRQHKMADVPVLYTHAYAEFIPAKTRSALHEMPGRSKDILFQLFNNFHIEHYKYNTYVERTTSKDRARYSHILHSRKGNEFLTRLAQEYPLLHKKFAGVNKKSNEKFDIDSLVSTDQITFLNVFNQFFRTGCKSITIAKPSPAMAKHLAVAKRKVLPAHPAKPGKDLEDSNYWKNYVHNMDPDIIEKNIKTATIKSRGLNLNLTYFEKSKSAPNILYIPSTSGYSLFSAELLYNMHLRGYNVFVVDFHGHGKSEGRRGDATINEISKNCSDAINYISKNFNGKIGVCGASLGGFATLYLGLSDKKVKSIACQNPTILTDTEFQEMLTIKSKGSLPAIKLLLAIFPEVMFPTITRSNDDSFTETDLERNYFKKSYVDPNTVKDYTGLALLSQVSTPPPRPLKELKIPTMFLAPSKDTVLMPLSYIKSLQDRLPSNIKKRIVKVNGGHWWMHSHPEEAAKVLCDWFDETLK